MEYRVTKYNPELRNEHGHYLRNEWTSYSDVGESAKLEEYVTIEKAYVDLAIAMMRETSCEGLYIDGLENSQNHTINLSDGDFLDLSDVQEIFRHVLREEIWCRFESSNHFVHLGYDYYMYIGTPGECPQSIELANGLGMYVENFHSPHKTKYC